MRPRPPLPSPPTVTLVFYDTNRDPLPITPTTGLVWLQNDPSAGTCNNPPGPGFTVSGAGFSLQVYPYESYDSDSSWWNGTAVLTLNTPSNLPPTPVTGFIKPKYQILTVYYPPPGSASSASYQTGFTTGSAISNSSTFLNSESESVSLKTGFSATIPLASAKTTFTAGETGQWSQTTTDSTTVTLSDTQSTTFTIPGPASSKDGIDHGEDIIYIWLNPEVSITTVQNIDVVTNGYFSDPNDPARGMNIVQLTVNQLQQALVTSNPTLISPDVQMRLRRTWDPAGGPLNSNDYQDILKADPFVANPAFDPRSDTSGRYTDAGVSMDYSPTDGIGQPTSMTYNVSSSSLTSTVTTKGDSHSTEFSLDESLSASVFGFAASEDFKQSYTYSVTSTTSHTSNNGSNQNASVTIYRPLLSDGYAGPTLIKVYRDNVYGTFMFYGAE